MAPPKWLINFLRAAESLARTGIFGEEEELFYFSSRD